MATQWPFRQVIGVEYSRPLHEVAVANIRKYRERASYKGDVTSICADAAQFELPATPCIIFMFNPFDGVIMERVARNAILSLRQHPRPFYVLYYNAKYADVLLGLGFRVLGSWAVGDYPVVILEGPSTADTGNA